MVMLVGLLASCTSGDLEAGNSPSVADTNSAAYEAGRRSAQMELERFGRPPETDECATAFEMLVSEGTDEVSDRTDWVAGCLEVRL